MGQRLTINEFEFLKEALSCLENTGQEIVFGFARTTDKEKKFWGSSDWEKAQTLEKVQQLRDKIEKMYE